MEIVSGFVTVLNLALCGVVGTRLLRRGHRESRPVETALALYFLFAGLLGTLLSCAAYATVARGAWGPADDATRILVFCSHIAYLIGTAAVYDFTAQVFRPGAAWARRLTAAGVAAFALGLVVEAFGASYAIVILPGFGYWLAFVARTGAFVWTAAEAIRYWHSARRRVRVGLAEPLVANRFLLWGLWAATLFVSACSEPVARVAYVLRAGTTTELMVDVVRPIIMGTIGFTSVLAGISLIALTLTFFPTPSFKRWVESRAAQRAL